MRIGFGRTEAYRERETTDGFERTEAYGKTKKNTLNI